MKLLCVDTSTSTESVAIVDDDDIICEVNAERGGIHGPDLLDDIHKVLKTTQLTLRELDGLVVGLGPGSFTGLRIGLATLKGLALAINKPIYGARTTTALLSAAGTEGTVAIIDARRQQIYVEGGPVSSPICCHPAEVWNYIGSDTPWRLVGDGALKYSEALLEGGPQCVIPDDAALHQPRAALLATLIDLNQPAALATLEPLYVRKSDAEINYPDGYPDAAKRPPREPNS